MSSRPEIPTRNPRSGRVDYHFAPAGAAAVATECDRLRQGQNSWLQGGLDHRAAALRAFAKALTDGRDTLIEALVTDTGRKAISIVEVDIIGPAIERWINIAEGLEDAPEQRSVALPFITYHIGKRPYDLAGIVSPWNFPLTLSIMDALPALLAGAAVIIKPSEITPRFADPLREIVAGAGEISSVLGIIDGDGEAGSAVVDNVDVVCFTGSVETGRKVAEQAARNFIPSFLELGGKDPAIVLATADIERAATALLRASVLNAGQACQSIERIYVARPIHDEFLAALIDKAEAVTLNTPDINKGHLGPIIFEAQADKIRAQIGDARSKGATIHTGGEIEDHGGLWCRPTVITGLTGDMMIMQDETFGPLLPVIPFDTIDEAINLANDSEFGLSAAVFAGSAEEAVAVGTKIEAGGISINDAALTSLMYEAEKDSFKLSGMGAPRMGASGYTRFFRRQSFMTNTADVFTINQFDEATAKESD